MPGNLSVYRPGDRPRTGSRFALGAAASSNVHIRLHDGPNTRYALLFRDFLRADDRARHGWGAFKQRLAQSVPDLLDYGQIKAPATEVLMCAAERWAEHTGWQSPSAS